MTYFDLSVKRYKFFIKWLKQHNRYWDYMNACKRLSDYNEIFQPFTLFIKTVCADEETYGNAQWVLAKLERLFAEKLPNYYIGDTYAIKHSINLWLMIERQFVKPIVKIKQNTPFEVFAINPDGTLTDYSFEFFSEEQTCTPWTAYIWTKSGQCFPYKRIKSINGKPFSYSYNLDKKTLRL